MSKSLNKLEPQITSAESGSMGHTFKVFLPENGATFYVKVSDTEKTNSVVILPETETAKKIEDLKNNYETEFLLLKLMNLMGLKTPTELGLVQHDEGAILFKRAAGDAENKSVSWASADNDWKTRFQIFTDALGIGDIDYCDGFHNPNLIPVFDREEKAERKQRQIAIDPKFIPNFIRPGSDKYWFINEAQPLQKFIYYYDQNRSEVDNVLKSLDDQFSLLIESRYEINKKYYAADRCESERVTQLSNPPSHRLLSLIESVKEKAVKENAAPYTPNPNGKYAARNVEGVLNTKIIGSILKSLKSQPTVTDLLPNELSAKVSTYCANGAKASETLESFSIGQEKSSLPPSPPTKPSSTMVTTAITENPDSLVKTPSGCCTIS